MKIRSITLRNYKRFVEKKTFAFTSQEGNVHEQSLIVGPNGSGKSTVLQAIVTLIASATRERFSPADSLDWPGYEYRLLQSGPMPLLAEAEIEFAPEELEATARYAEDLRSRGVALGEAPAQSLRVRLWLDYEQRKVKVREQPFRETLYQFSGYQYAKRLAAMTVDKSSLFEDVGNIYWYTEQRNSFSLSNMLENEQPQLNFLRSFLSNAYTYHMSLQRGDRQMREGEFDFYAKLKGLYERVFPGRTFVGAAPRFDIYEQSPTPDFFLSDGANQYELAGMSAGERAIFPMLMDFARWNINHSIIIIDEVELHLHPPLQQALIRVLPTLGQNNQFILTTHSDAVAVFFDENDGQLIRFADA